MYGLEHSAVAAARLQTSHVSTRSAQADVGEWMLEWAPTEPMRSNTLSPMQARRAIALALQA